MIRHILRIVPILLFSFSICLYGNSVESLRFKTSKKCINCVNNLIDEYQDYLSESNEISDEKSSEIKNGHFLNDSINSIEKSYYDFSEFQRRFASNLSPISTKLKLSAFEFLYSMELSNGCLSALFHWFNGLKEGELWAYQILDSSGVKPSGLTQGVFSSFGEYDQCLGIRSDSTEDQESNDIIYGKYCLVKPFIPINDFRTFDNFNGISILDESGNKWIKNLLKKNINKIKLLLSANQMTKKLYAFYYGICIPSQCQPKDIEILLKTVIPQIIPISLEVGPKCQTINDKIEWNLFNTFIVAFPILLFVLVIISTLYSVKYQNPSQQKSVYFHELMKSFSLIESNKRLFSPLKDRILVVDLLFLWTLFWFCVSMNYAIILTGGGLGFKRLMSSFAVTALTSQKYFWLRIYFPRNSIFFFSGLLISLDFFTKTIPISLLSYLKFAFENWYRFFIKTLGPILFFGLVLLLGDGPFFTVLSDQNKCSESFWKTIFLCNQFVSEVFEMCNPYVWFYLVIFQLNLISPLFLVPFVKSFKFGLIFNLLAILVFGFVKIVPKLFFGFNLIPFEISKFNLIDDMRRAVVRHVFFTDQYIYLFILGIVVGYFIRKKQKLITKATKTKCSKFILTIICYSMTVLSVVWSENFKDMNKEQNQLNIMSWFVLGDILWLTGIIWTIFLFHQSHIQEGVLNKLESSKALSAVIRLVLAILVNFSVVICLMIFTRRSNVEISHLNQFQLFYNSLSLAVIVSYLMYVFLEYPFIRFLEIIKNRRNVIQYNNNEIKVVNVVDISCQD